MNTVRNITDDTGGCSKTLSDFLTPRFLGVICHFERNLISDNEKELKQKVLLSLGELMRFMGSDNITKFRFKLLAVLRTALTINEPELKDICAKIWKIFISTVDLRSLGPLLSTIFVSLEPLLETHPVEVNEILKYLIIQNGSLLSVHVPDLFFVQDTKASQEIKRFVSESTKRITETFMDKFEALMRHINHDNLTVRIYGLNYLTDLFESNRLNLNELIIGQRKMHLIIENLLDILMIGIKNLDESLQIATGRCVGKLGALEPSHLSPNYSPQQVLAAGIFTNDFAIMALKELCKAYQFQKDTKNVDGYSLAIQEILLAREVCPKENKNMAVWEAIPERMRPLMEPLLTSCYTMTNNYRTTCHPIFGTDKFRTFEDWAIKWAINVTESIEDEAIKGLLRSFRASMRYDLRMLSIFLPYIVIHALQLGGPECHKEIAEELICVFTSVINPAKRHDSDKSRKQIQSVRCIDFTPCNSEAGQWQPAENNDVAIKCAKLAFNQLDFVDR